MGARQRPNILLITCHDLGRFLGCYGVPTVRTPHLDRLAAEGVRLTRAFCTAPQCSPSRASLYTGRYPHSNGVMGLTHGDFAWDLHPDERHLAQYLGSIGYDTRLIGIIHEARSAERCGFDEVIPPQHGEPISDQTLAILRRCADQPQPFYLQLGYHEPHRVACPGEERPDFMGFTGDYIAADDSLGLTIPPYLADTPQTRAEIAELQGAVAYMDAALGRVLEGLRSLGLDEQTLVIFTTDHGLALPRAKCTLYDPGLETALLMRLPGRGWSGGTSYPQLVSNVDITPTLLDLVGLPVDAALQGRSLLPLLDGGAYQPRPCMFAEMTYHDYYDPQRCIRTETHKLIVNFSAAPAFMNPSQSWQPRSRPVTPPDPPVAYHPLVELYDLERDPFEQQNLAEDRAQQALRADLLARLYEWMRTTDDPLLHGAVTSPTHLRAIAALQHPDDRPGDAR
ncbi:MAG TPA: sulfatase [Herpetosiphonaceae bacterium]